jgi:hypothetical protein
MACVRSIYCTILWLFPILSGSCITTAWHSYVVTWTDSLEQPENAHEIWNLSGVSRDRVL